jgi:serine/threonine protein kinase/tetratricopeptide (TPR) repeat protein
VRRGIIDAVPDDATESPATEVEGSPRTRATDAELARGSLVGRYVVIDTLGAGGMGVVYEAYDPELHRRVAIKLMQTGANRDRLAREAQALARVSHPNVVAVYDVGSIGDQVFIAMELVEGETLTDWRERTKPSWRETLTVFAAAGQGLAAAHAAGVVHRDFKPSNVQLGKDGRVRVLDFGLARAAGDTPRPARVRRPPTRGALVEDLTRTGSVLGTPVYMPPEAARGELASEPGDQYSFCVSLYEALYGQRPFDWPPADETEQIPAPPAESRVPAWVRRVVFRGLAFSPEQRWASMSALLDALAADPAVRRRRLVTVAAAVLVVAALVVAGFSMRPSPSTTDVCAIKAPLADVWSPEIRNNISTGFTAWPEQGARTTASLDDAATRWLAARSEACRDTRDRRSQPEAVLLLRLACLDRQRDDLSALVALFQHADGAVAQRATKAVHELPRPSVCMDARSLAYVDPPLPPLRPRVDELRKQISEARAQLLSGFPDNARTQLQALTQAVRDVAYKPLVAEHAYLLARAQSDIDVALPYLEIAEQNAIESRMDDLVAKVTAYRVSRAGSLGKPDALIVPWTASARAWIARTRDLEAEVNLESGLGYLAVGRGKPEEALPHLERAALLGDQVFGEANSRVIAFRGSAGFSLIQLGRYREAADGLAAAIAVFERTYGNDSTGLAVAVDNYGLALTMLGRYDEARAVFERGLGMKSIGPLARGALRSDLSRVLLADGDIAGAVESASSGVAELRSIHLERTALAVNLDPLAAALLAGGRHTDSLAVSLECLEEFAKASNDGVDTVPCLAIKGSALIALGRPVEAIPVLELSLSRQAGRVAPPGLVANVRYQLARALVASGGDRQRATELATQARDELARFPFQKRLLDEVDAWIAAK